MLDRLLTVDEAAEFLGLSVHTLYSWTSAKKIPYCKIGGRLRFSEEALWRWTKAHIVEPLEKVGK